MARSNERHENAGQFGNQFHPRGAGPHPQDSANLFHEGCRLLDEGQSTEAAKCLCQAAELLPDHPAVLEKLAVAYRDAGQYLLALRSYDRLIELGAATATTWCETGNILRDVGEYAQAIGAYENSLKQDADLHEAENDLAQVCYRLGDVDRALHHLEHVVSNCDTITPWLNLATLIPGAPTATQQQILEVRTAFAEKLRQWDERSIQRTRPQPRLTEHSRLRIGYLSAFFDGPNYMKPVWGLINHHDRSGFEIHLFSDDPSGSDMPGYVQHPRDHVHAIDELDNEQLAGLIRETEIDILVDLNAYSVSERLALFLEPVAPVTAAWFNMYATSGLPAFDYILGDDEVVRPEEDRFYSEQVIRLPASYLTFQVDHPVPRVTAPPCLESGFVTFGSLVSQYKITPRVFDAWAEILKRCETAHLLLANSALKSRYNREYVVERFVERGVEPEQVVLCEPSDHLSFLKYYDRIDIALDAFPYNGGTTTMEAIWQGVPVLTFDGDRWASRTSQTLLRRTHLADFVASDETSMIELAVDLAHDPTTPPRFSGLRTHMRDKLKLSSACNTKAFAKCVEDCYRSMWTELATQ